MTTITLPPEIEEPLLEQARRLGTEPELLALDALRRLFLTSDSADTQPKPETLFDLLVEDIGSVDGATEAFSENCGQRFTESLAEQKQQGPS